jgi:tRNA threonylcarbamoyladenosine dehydratase
MQTLNKSITRNANQNADLDRRFGGIARLYGADGLNRFANASVCVVGIGGVGSWAVESLARSGIGGITLVDMDHVSESNINRQLLADSSSLGRAKIDVMADRVYGINPTCEINPIDDFVTVENATELLIGKFFYIIDCAENFWVMGLFVV